MIETKNFPAVPSGNKQVLRLAAVMHKTGLPKSTIYLRINQGDFPGQVRLGPRSVGWLLTDVESWLDERVRASVNAA